MLYSTDGLPLKWAVALLALFLYPLLRAFQNVYFHSLSKIPGPKPWACSRLPFIQALIRGTVVQDIQRLHQQYGPIVRIAPDEVTFAQPEAWTDILRADFPKGPRWWAGESGRESVMTALQSESHVRIRKVLAPAFTTRALKGQEPILQQYVNLLVERLRDLVNREPATNIAAWCNYTTFDIFGDLGYGESFKCLQDSRYHPWISLIFNSEKAACFGSAARFYPLIELVLTKCMPASLREEYDNHRKLIADKVQRRLNLEQERPDIMSYVTKGNKGEGLPLDTINAAFLELTTAGSETTATVLSGTLNYLVNNRDKLSILEQEIRGLEGDSLSLNTLQDLPYLNAVLKEGLRLCPPVPWILSRRIPDGGAHVCGIWLPAGTAVSIQAYSMSRNSDYFHNASPFVPERWLPDVLKDPSSPFSNDRREAVQPFSVGPYSCIDQHLAWAEMRLILAKLIWTFDFTAGAKLEWESLRTFLLVEKKPIEVKITVREGYY